MNKYLKIISLLIVLSSCSTNYYIKKYYTENNLAGKVNAIDSNGFINGKLLCFSYLLSRNNPKYLVYVHYAKHGILDSHYCAYNIKTNKLVEMGKFIPNQTPLKAVDYIQTKGKYSNATINFPNETNCEVYAKAFYPNELPKWEYYYNECHLFKIIEYYSDTAQIRSIWFLDRDSLAKYYRNGKFEGYIKHGKVVNVW